jgi:alkanesulfonate monooxygenase SsuD/methylene tetrahydromethanopterin reductase-like flavin-dependent oxidoreductase (luciferase family)
VDHLRAQAVQADAGGAGSVFLDEGPLGDPIVLLAGLSASVPTALLGVRLGLAPEGRHPAMIAREVTSLDLVCGGRSIVCFVPPFDDRLAEAIALCRAMWRDGTATSDGPNFPVVDAVNRPRPAGTDSPRVALDLTGGEELPGAFEGVADLLLLLPNDAPGACRVERA